MKNVTKLFLAAILFCALGAKSQQKVFFNIEGGLGTSHVFLSEGALTRNYGGTVGIKIAEKIDLEGGYYRVKYNVPSTWATFRTNQVAIRASYNLPLREGKFVLVPAIGFRIGELRNFSYQTASYTGSDTSGIPSSEKHIKIGTKSNLGEKEFFPSLELRLGAEYWFFKTFAVGFNASYYIGLGKNIATIDFVTNHSRGQTTGRESTKGSFFAPTLSVKYTISDLFSPKKSAY